MNATKDNVREPRINRLPGLPPAIRDVGGHTPGPWISTGYVEDGHEVPHFKIEQDLRNDAGFLKDICPLIAKSTYGSESEMAANARLIAAAPELLAVLQEAALPGGMSKEMFFRWLPRARAAIAKAGGAQ